MFEPNCDSEFFEHEVDVDKVNAWFSFRDSKFHRKFDDGWVLRLITRQLGEDRDLTES